MKLEQHELAIATGRKVFREHVTEMTVKILNKTYQGVSVAASYVYQFGLDLWGLAQEWELDIFGIETVPAGKILMTVILATKGRMLLKLHGLAYLVVRLNYEIAKSRGIL